MARILRWTSPHSPRLGAVVGGVAAILTVVGIGDLRGEEPAGGGAAPSAQLPTADGPGPAAVNAAQTPVADAVDPAAQGAVPGPGGPAAEAAPTTTAAAAAPTESAAPTEVAVSEGDPSAPAVEPRYRLEFRESPWLEVLKWYAEKASLNLDWLKLPEGPVNLSLQEPYTLSQIRDLLNMQLLARGYTLLERSDVLRIVPLEDLDPTLIPRVAPDALAAQPTHQFVRVSFPLDWMVAEQAAKDLAPLLSPYGKLIPMGATNHLEAMDAVVNLLEVKKLLDREQSTEGRQMLVEEFVIHHRRADEVAEKLRGLLGMNSRGRRDWDDRMRLDIERTRLQAQAVDKLGKDATKFLQQEPEVHMVINEEKNSILVNAPPDKVALVRQAVTALDQPHDRTEEVLENIGRMKIYRLHGADADALLDMVDELRDLGNLDDQTRVDVDSDGERVLVYGGPADQLVVAHLLQGLEKEERRAEVIPLQVLEPRYATQAVLAMFTENSEQARWRRYRQEDGFRVHADVANRRLLLWATPEETEQVYQFLAKLGEGDAGGAGQGRRYQVVQTSVGTLREIENRLRAVWESLSDAPLVVETSPDADTAGPAERDAGQQTTPAASPPTEDKPAEDPRLQTASARMSFAIHRVSRTTADEASASEEGGTAAGGESGESQSPSDRAAPDAAPPIKVVEAGDGRLIIASEDPATVGLMQQVLRDLMPEEDTVKVFPLEHASALSVQFQVEDLLIGPPGRDDDDDDGLAIAPQQEVSVFADTRTNRLLVRDATPEQLEFIERVIETLDQPEEVDPELVRQQEIYSVRYKSAEELADTVKDVYQDLLSSSDKAFAGRGDRDRRSSYGYWGFTDTRSKKPQYQGLLSIGVEASSNSLVVSAPGYLLKEVMALIHQLDRERSATSTVVLPIDGRLLDTQSVQEALDGILSGRPQPTRISGPERRRR